MRDRIGDGNQSDSRSKVILIMSLEWHRYTYRIISQSVCNRRKPKVSGYSNNSLEG